MPSAERRRFAAGLLLASSRPIGKSLDYGYEARCRARFVMVGKRNNQRKYYEEDLARGYRIMCSRSRRRSTLHWGML